MSYTTNYCQTISLQPDKVAIVKRLFDEKHLTFEEMLVLLDVGNNTYWYGNQGTFTYRTTCTSSESGDHIQQ